MREDKTTFPILELPAELRNRIYEYTLTEPEPIELPQRNPANAKGVSAKERKEDRKVPCLKEPPLLSTCRQIRRESLGIYFSCNIFEGFCINHCVSFLSNLSDEKLGMIRAVRLWWEGTAWKENKAMPEGMRDVLESLEEAKEEVGRGGLLRDSALFVPVMIGSEIGRVEFLNGGREVFIHPQVEPEVVWSNAPAEDFEWVGHMFRLKVREQ